MGGKALDVRPSIGLSLAIHADVVVEAARSRGEKNLVALMGVRDIELDLVVSVIGYSMSFPHN